MSAVRNRARARSVRRVNAPGGTLRNRETGNAACVRAGNAKTAYKRMRGNRYAVLRMRVVNWRTGSASVSRNGNT